MSDTPRSLPTLSFGAPTTSTSSGFGLSNQTSTSDNKMPSNLFGSTTNTPTTSSNPFGSVGVTSGATKPQSLFGGGANAGQGSSLFGGPGGTNNSGSTGFSFGPQPTVNNNQSSGFSFGKPPETGSTQATNTAQPFSGFLTPNKASVPASSGQSQTPSLFGGASNSGGSGLFGSAVSTTPATSRPSGSFSFANPSTTPAGPPPSAGNGGSTGGFSFNKPQQQSANAFGAQKAAHTSAQESSTTAAPSNLFGSLPQPSSGGLFGSSKPADTTVTTTAAAPSSNLFASTNVNSGPGLFNMRATGGLFSNLGKSQESTPPASTAAAVASTPATTGASQQPLQSPQDGAVQNSKLFAGLDTKDMGTTATSQGTAPSLFSPLGSGPSSSTPPTTTQPLSIPAAATTTTATPSLFSNLGASTASTSAATPATVAPAGGLFAHLAKPQDKSTSAAGGIPSSNLTSGISTASAPAPSSGLFADLNKSATSTATSQPAITAAADLGNNSSNSTSAANFGTSTSGPAPPAQSRLKNKSMDEIITRWASDLSKYQKEFQSQADQVAKWDRMLVENSEKIQKLYGSTLEAERATSEVERQLSAVEGQQEELGGWLDRYEREVEEMTSRQVGQGEGLQGPDQERERTYKLAEKLSERLDEMGKDLTSMIEEINGASSMISKNSRADDPISQIVRVLNSHLSQLQMIDQGAAALQAKVTAAQKAGQGLGSSNGLKRLGNDAADDFYRSYMGRR
ncbi:MAG: FG-nucleoporin nsp1 [Pleopsidium flavum]|nr:MAG: FG-nucleoporin nsp1 [Pleopsidium flavum]